MTSTSNPGRNAPACAATTLRSIAATALLATALLGAGAAQASLVLFTAQGTLVADTTGSDSHFALPSAVGGVISQSVQSQIPLDTGDGALARATLDSVSTATHLTATGVTEAVLTDGVSANAVSLYEQFFTLTSRYQISGHVNLQTAGAFDPQRLTTDFAIHFRQPGNNVIILTADEPSDFDVLLTLDPGDYLITAGARFAGESSVESGSASFTFDLTATELGEPPRAVPEPHSLALVLAGLLGCGAVRQRRRSAASAVA